MDYDTRFKLLLTLFFREFIELFLPEFAARIAWRQPSDFLDKELQDLLPERPKGTVDLLVKVRSKEPPRRGKPDRICLIHVEVEGRKSRRSMGRRMWHYFCRLTEMLGLPVVPVVIYLKVGGDGLGWQSYDVRVWDHCFNHFEFPYIGLPKLDGQAYIEQSNPVGWALSGLMHVPASERARVKAESLQRAARSRLAQRQRLVLVECIDSFTVLDKQQVREFEQLIVTEKYEKAKTMIKTTYEQGIERGIERGIEQGIEQGIAKSQCELLLLQLEEKFGPVSERARNKVERMSNDQRRQLARRILTAQKRSELGL